MASGLSPMMQEYIKTKEEYKDCIIFYRLGDFYEMFFEDAKLVSKELELTLTGKSCGLEEKAPMCGVPFHSCDQYIDRLVENGHKVAIVEQVEDPATAKGLVKREVIRVVTPGTNCNSKSLDEGKNNYIMSIVSRMNRFGISIADVATGDYYLTEVSDVRGILDEINRYTPAEIIYEETLEMSSLDFSDLKNRLKISFSLLEDWYFEKDMAINTLKNHFHVMALDGLGLSDYPVGMLAAGGLLKYLLETQKTSLAHITSIKPYETGKYMIIDTSTRRNLELLETLREKQKRGTLLWVLDKTKTAMGARLLRKYIEQPLIHKSEILKRQEIIQCFNDHLIARDELREYLSSIYDLERLIGRITYKTANPRDLIAFKTSLAMLPGILSCMEDLDSELLEEIKKELDPLQDIHNLIEQAIIDEPPLTVREGGIIKEGYHEEVDRLKSAQTQGKDWLAKLEEEEKETTGIKNLRIKYSKVFGYSFEVTNSYKDLVPKNWVRKQTLSGAERYTTDRLKELEDTILGAKDRVVTLEYNLFTQVRDQIASQVTRIQNTARAIAKLDVFASLAYVAGKSNYCKPEINHEGIIDIKGGRHPVVEKMIPENLFVDNDTYLDSQENRTAIITGPNMAGKSTYMRQVALICLMAQIGSYVPASAANISISDRIFTRVGASDDLASGQSTFMVEMTEVANILRNASKDSLLILDEIGRGTSTFDGLSIAWAVAEFINDKNRIGAKTLFATHYHELTELEGTIFGIHNYCIAVKEDGDNIVFLRKIVKGGADKSYGIQVAKLAGVPDEVITRAKELVEKLSQADINVKSRVCQVSAENTLSILSKNEDTKKQEASVKKASMKEGGEEKNKNIEVFHQLNLFESSDEKEALFERLMDYDISNSTPMAAMNLIYELQQEYKHLKKTSHD